MDDAILEKLERLESRLDHLEKQIRKTVKQRELTLQEKFRLHDHAQGILRWFDEITSDLPDNVFFYKKMGDSLDMKEVSIKNLKEIVTRLVKLVDHALGVEFP